MPDRIGGRADFELLVSGYDGAIRYLDEHLAPLPKGLPPARPRDAIVFSHGLHTRQRSVFDGPFLYTRTYRRALTGFGPIAGEAAAV